MNTLHYLPKWPLVALLLVAVVRLGAQTDPDMPASRFSLSVEGNAGVSDRLYINDGTVPASIADVIEDGERPDIAWEAALLSEYRISRWFGIQTGIRYTRWGYRSAKEPLIWANPEPGLADASRTQQKLVFIGVPIRGTIHLNWGKTRWTGYLGWSPGLTISHQHLITLYYPDRTETNDIYSGAEYREFNMTGEAGFGLVVPISSSLSLSFTPNIRMHTWGFYEDVPLNRRLFSYGLSAGLTMN